ncbi:MAG: hypothetical protein ABJD24_03690 [Acidimicrobiales bacterium]
MNKLVVSSVVSLVAAATMAIPATAAFADGATTSTPTPTAPTGADSVRFEAAKVRCLAAIDARQVQIGILKTEARAPKLTDSHRATVVSFLDAAASGLATVKTDVQAATTIEELRAACSTVVPDYRIYVLRTPQVHLAIGFDLNDVSVNALTKAADALQKAIDAERAAGKDVTDAQAKLDQMRAELSAATAATAGQADSELALTPADYNANHDVLAPFRAALTTARGHVRTAASLARQIVGEL